MGFGDAIKKGFEIGILKEETIKKVVEDKSLNGISIGIVLLTIFFTYLFSFLMNMLMSSALSLGMGSSAALGVSAVTGIVMIFVYTLVIFALSFTSTLVVFLIAKAFGGKGGYMDLYRVMGLGTVIKIVGAIPVLGSFLMLLVMPYYFFGVGSVVVKNVFKISSGKSVGVMVISFLIMMIPIVLLMVLAGVAMMSAFDTSGLNTISGYFVR